MRARTRLPRLLLVVLCAANPAAAGDPTGLWWAEQGAAQVEIRECEGRLCGQVVWLRSPFDEFGCPLRDEKNPDPALRDRDVVGLELLRGLRPSPGSRTVWIDGEVYDPGSGHSYRATLRLDGPDRLRLRGFVGIEWIGRTTTWIRVGAEGVCVDLRRGNAPGPGDGVSSDS